jgi:hypothetical protein
MVEIDYLLNKIKEKKELSGLDNSIVLVALEKQIRKGHFNLSILKKKDIKKLVKLTRNDLRITVGSFNVNFSSSKLDISKVSSEELISLHTSTRERILLYPWLKEFIKKLDVNSILDLGCGLNPLALASKDYVYYASDINGENISLVNNFFKHNNLKGKAFIFDLRNIKKDRALLPSADLCLLLKVFDVIEKRGHKLAEEIITSLDCKYFLISFSTKTLSGKPMNHPQRGWIERMLSRLGYSYKIIKEKNEIFYLFEKSQPVKNL